jgi:hypothetical protein
MCIIITSALIAAALRSENQSSEFLGRKKVLLKKNLALFGRGEVET